MEQRRAADVLILIGIQVVARHRDSASHPVRLEFLLGDRHHQELEQMSLTGHAFVEVLLVFAGFEEPRGKAAVGVAVDLRGFDVLSDLLIGGKPDSAERFAAAEMNISGSSQGK